MAYSRLTGDWKRAGITLQRLATKLSPFAKAVLYENGEIVVERMKAHIDNQDLDWTPLSDTTIRLKNGDDTIYVDTGYLKENLSVRRLKSSVSGSTIFIGASPWKKTETGVKFSDLMIWLEYGTENMPPRPLIRPTFEEMKSEVIDNFKEAIQRLVEGD